MSLYLFIILSKFALLQMTKVLKNNQAIWSHYFGRIRAFVLCEGGRLWNVWKQFVRWTNDVNIQIHVSYEFKQTIAQTTAAEGVSK